jgi:hypothetical protein
MIAEIVALPEFVFLIWIIYKLNRLESRVDRLNHAR